MLEAIGRNEVDAIIVYHGDRLIRQPWDLELLLRLADERGMHLASPTGERDLDNPDDRYILRIEAAGNCRESDNTSRRLRRHYDRMAELGIARLGGRGGRAFGFEQDGLTVRDDDAKMVREVADRILRSESTGAICKDLNLRGYRTTAGNPWNHGALRKVMLRPRLAGLLSHHGQIVGPAVWAAILDRDTWEAVCATLQGKTALFDYATNTRRYLLSGIAQCGTCLQPLIIRQTGRSKTLRDGTVQRYSMVGYGCIHPACTRKVHRSVHQLDPYVEGAVLALLQDDRIRTQLATPVQRDMSGELAKLEARRERKLVEFADDDDPLAADVLRVVIRKIDEQIAEVRAVAATSQATRVLTDMWGIDLEGWQRLDLHRQRSVVRTLVRVVVLPSRKGPGFDPSAVRLEPAYI
jgi:site-specific DNA recombinase